jgi:hypothetical protein
MVLACAASLFASFPPVSHAAPPLKRTAKLLCNQGGVVCVPASLSHALISNPLTVNIQVTSPLDVDVDWELRDSTGNVLDFGSTEDRGYWAGQHPSPRRTMHVMDFILKPSASTQGTLVLSPVVCMDKDRDGQNEGQDLPQLTIPVRLSTARSVVTLIEPQDPNRFHENYFNWANTHLSTDPTSYQTDMPFTTHQFEVMRFDRKAAVGVIAAAIIDRYRGEGPFYVTHWSLVGSTAHIAMDGSAWSGVSNYVSLVNYLIRRSVSYVPGVEDYVSRLSN